MAYYVCCMANPLGSKASFLDVNYLMAPIQEMILNWLFSLWYQYDWMNKSNVLCCEVFILSVLSGYLVMAELQSQLGELTVGFWNSVYTFPCQCKLLLSSDNVRVWGRSVWQFFGCSQISLNYQVKRNDLHAICFQHLEKFPRYQLSINVGGGWG